MKFEITRSIQNDVATLAAIADVSDAESDPVFADPANNALWAKLTSSQAAGLRLSERAQLWADLVKLVENEQADQVVPAPEEPEEPQPSALAPAPEE